MFDYMYLHEHIGNSIVPHSHLFLVLCSGNIPQKRGKELHLCAFFDSYGARFCFSMPTYMQVHKYWGSLVYQIEETKNSAAVHMPVLLVVVLALLAGENA
jgi:hypothetical protein